MKGEVDWVPWSGDVRKVLGNSPGELLVAPLSQRNFMEEAVLGTGGVKNSWGRKRRRRYLFS